MAMFLDLYTGKRKQIIVSVDGCSVRDWKYKCSGGIFKLTHKAFVKICDTIAIEELKSSLGGHITAKACDEHGLENRWFRRATCVSKWVNKTKMISKIDAHIG